MRQIVDATKAVIVLTSTWKDYWYRIDKDDQDELANYLDRKLKAAKLRILDKTEDNWRDRGVGILNWISAHSVESFVILDDETFDYAELGLLDRWVETTEGSDNGGLQDEHVEQAIALLNTKQND